MTINTSNEYDEAVHRSHRSRAAVLARQGIRQQTRSVRVQRVDRNQHVEGNEPTP